jgi:hypothetical protein
MSVVTLKAHYDGEKICLDEPFELLPNTPVLVTVPQPDAESQDRAEWFALAKAAFARTYDDDEPDYSNAVILERP